MVMSPTYMMCWEAMAGRGLSRRRWPVPAESDVWRVMANNHEAREGLAVLLGWKIVIPTPEVL